MARGIRTPSQPFVFTVVLAKGGGRLEFVSPSTLSPLTYAVCGMCLTATTQQGRLGDHVQRAVLLMSLAPVTERESTSSDHYILGPNTTAIWTVAMDMVDAACEDGVVRHLAIRNREQDYSPLVARLSLCLLLILRPHFAVGNRPARDGPQAPIVRRCFSNRNMLWLSGDRCVRHPREAKQKGDRLSPVPPVAQ